MANMVGAFFSKGADSGEVFDKLKISEDKDYRKHLNQQNVADVRDDLALMVSGEGVSAKIREYAATSMNLNTRDETLSAMVVYEFLSL